MIVLTVPPLLFGVTFLSGPVMARVCKRYAVTGRTHVPVPTKASLGFKVIPQGADTLQETIDTVDEEFEILAYSQGAQIVGEWLRRGGRSDKLSRIILIGNPERGIKHGAKASRAATGGPLPDTPTNTGYRILDVARFGDKFAAPKGLPDFRARSIHCSYWNVDIEHLGAGETVGNTTFVEVP